MLSPVAPLFLVSGLYARATSAAGICTSARQDRRSGFQFSPSASYDSYELGTQLSSARSLDTVHLAPDRTRNVPLDIPVDGMLLISPLGSDDDGDSPALTPVSPPVQAAPLAHPVPTVPPATRPSPLSFTSPRAPRGLPSPTASPPLADDGLPGLVDDSSDDSDSSAPSRRLSCPSPPPASPPAKKKRAKRHRRRPSSVLPGCLVFRHSGIRAPSHGRSLCLPGLGTSARRTLTFSCGLALFGRWAPCGCRRC